MKLHECDEVTRMLIHDSTLYMTEQFMSSRVFHNNFLFVWFCFSLVAVSRYMYVLV